MGTVRAPGQREALPPGVVVLDPSRKSAETAAARMGGARAAFEAARAPRPLLIVLPLYRRPDLARAVVRSLIDCAEEIRALDGELLLLNDCPGDRLLAQVLDALVAEAGDVFACRLDENERNLGFVRTVNKGLETAARQGMDALILNSDTVVFPGALRELVRVSRLDPMTGFVNPRSNNATLATLPFQDRFRHLGPHDAHAAWSQIQGHLPAVSYVPVTVGFCMLIRWAMLAEFGVFDEIYGRGYNEENDLVMRAGRRGYRAVLANHAFVWHEGGGSFRLGAQTHAHDLANRAKLTARYPEFWEFVQDHFRSPAIQAETLLGALIPGADGRLQVALDFSHFAPAYNGTFKAGRALLATAVAAWSDRYEVSVICTQEAYDFHDLQATGAERRDVDDPGQFAAIFRVGQPFDYGALERLCEHAPVFGVFMLDTISMDCTALATTRHALIWGFTAAHADLVVAQSETTAGQLDRRLDFAPDVLRAVCPHSLDLDDYRMAPDAEPLVEAGYLLVVGNHYWHKDVASAANALAAADPHRRVVAIVGAHEAQASEDVRPVDEGRYAPRGLITAANVTRIGAGELTDGQIGALYANAQAVVFPTHYEGFGIPVLNALAARRPVFVRPLPVFEEMERALGGDPNLHVFATTRDLVAQLALPVSWRAAGASRGVPGDAEREAREIGEALDAAVAGASYEKIVRRLSALHLMRDYARDGVAGEPSPSPAVLAEAMTEPKVADKAQAAQKPPPEGLPALELELGGSGEVPFACEAAAPEPTEVAVGAGTPLAGHVELPPEPVIVFREPVPPTPKAFVARSVGRGVERVAAAFLRVPGVFAGLRALVHVARAVGLAREPQRDDAEVRV